MKLYNAYSKINKTICSHKNICKNVSIFKFSAGTVLFKAKKN